MNWQFIGRHALFGAGLGAMCFGAGATFGFWIGAGGVALNAFGWWLRECWDHGWTVYFDRQGHAEWIAPAAACASVWLAWLLIRGAIA